MTYFETASCCLAEFIWAKYKRILYCQDSYIIAWYKTFVFRIFSSCFQEILSDDILGSLTAWFMLNSEPAQTIKMDDIFGYMLNPGNHLTFW